MAQPNERRIVPGKFNDEPVLIGRDHPLFAQSVTPEAFAAAQAPAADPNEGAGEPDDPSEDEVTVEEPKGRKGRKNAK